MSHKINLLVESHGVFSFVYACAGQHHQSPLRSFFVMSQKKGLGKLERFELEIPPSLEFVTRSLHSKATSGNEYPGMKTVYHV